jgi:hypothetical protein
MQGKTPVIVADTAVLKIGNIYSVYYNWTSALRDSIYRETVSTNGNVYVGQRMNTLTFHRREVKD